MEDPIGDRAHTVMREPCSITYHLWTSAGIFWPGDSTLQSRAFDPAHGVRLFQQELAQHEDLPPDPFLSQEQLAALDQQFALTMDSLAGPTGQPMVVILSTEGPAERVALEIYVEHEPLGLLVLALSTTTGEPDLITDRKLDWASFAPSYAELAAQLRDLLAHRRVADALAAAMHWVTAQLHDQWPEILRRA